VDEDLGWRTMTVGARLCHGAVIAQVRYTPAMRIGLILAGLGITATLGGCLERRMTITSQPPGATVTVNDVEIGRTPVTASFVYFGKYDVQLEREGYQPLRVKAKASTPIYEYPPIDLLASAFPMIIRSDVRFHYVLEPQNSTGQAREEAERSLVERAHAFRKQVQ
jgi:hypothetical protein